MDQVSFRPLTIDDLSLMHRWLAMPHVNEWWHERLDLDGVHAKYVPGIEGIEPTHVFVIECARPIGWIQWYRWANYPKHAALLGAEPETAGIDLAIGEVTALNLGLGSRAIRAFVESVVFAEAGITACISDPETANRRSIRAFEKAGFAVLNTVQHPDESVTRCIVRRAR